MALSTRTKRIVEVALADRKAAAELDARIDRQAAAVAKLGATSNLVGVDGTGSNAAPLAGTEARLDAIEAKLDAVIQALKDAALMK